MDLERTGNNIGGMGEVIEGSDVWVSKVANGIQGRRSLNV